MGRLKAAPTYDAEGGPTYDSEGGSAYDSESGSPYDSKAASRRDFRSASVPRLDRSTVIGSASAAALFLWTAFVGAQAPAAPPAPAGQAAPPPQAAGRGGLPGTERGWATFQGQCVGCHGIIGPIGVAPTARKSVA